MQFVIYADTPQEAVEQIVAYLRQRRDRISTTGRTRDVVSRAQAQRMILEAEADWLSHTLVRPKAEYPFKPKEEG